MAGSLKNALVASSMLMSAAAGHAQAQSFGSAYFFGDSLTDCCNEGRSTNLQLRTPNWADVLPSLIGANYTATALSNYAIGGAQSGVRNAVSANELVRGFETGYLPQVQRFLAQHPTVSSRDIAGIWTGTNDIWPATYPAGGNPFAAAGISVLQSVGGQPSAQTVANYISGNVRAGIDGLVARGIRNIVLVTPYDMSQSTFSNPAALPLAQQYSMAVRDQLATLYTPGVNTYFVDNLRLLQQIQANPERYGFISTTAARSCTSTSGCSSAPVSVQNQYVFNDGIHYTSGMSSLLALYTGNIINARDGLSAQGDISQGAGQAFSSTLMNRLDAYRRLNTPVTVPGTFTADLPNRAITPSSIPVMLGSPLSLFVEGMYAGIDRNARATPNGPSNPALGADFAGVTAGIEYRATPNLLLGAAFNYLNTSTDSIGRSRTAYDLDSFQGGVFASYNTPNFFLDGALTYGVNNFGLRRQGIVDAITASPDGNTFTAAAKIGYLFDFGTFRVGPLAELTYANVQVGSYRETGDPVLTLGVRKQDFDGLTGGAGVQIRTALPIFGGLISPFVNLTAQHDFLDGVRTITSFGTPAPALLINTSAGRRGDDVYGKVAGGFSVDLGNGLNGVVSGSSTFGRSYGDDYTASAGLRYRF
ncbi:autotransporter domain-containing protein [Methylorubrum thiocyanatum]|uniref:autotransporter domain-containing protein n=1 Tax=Methylorubrum thiocyanatum TaxID=47958 RepID=UPI00383B5D74